MKAAEAHAGGSRAAINASCPHNRRPWSRCVKLYGSNRCWELSEFQGPPDHGSR